MAVDDPVRDGSNLVLSVSSVARLFILLQEASGWAIRCRACMAQWEQYA